MDNCARRSSGADSSLSATDLAVVGWPTYPLIRNSGSALA